ncbi:hypothetical protein ACJX0J_021747 [Zea mays]
MDGMLCQKEEKKKEMDFGQFTLAFLRGFSLRCFQDYNMKYSLTNWELIIVPKGFPSHKIHLILLFLLKKILILWLIPPFFFIYHILLLEKDVFFLQDDFSFRKKRSFSSQGGKGCE